MPTNRITEYYPTATSEGHAAINVRVADAPRDLASTILLWSFCLLALAQIAVAVAAVAVAGLHLEPPNMCADQEQPSQHQPCYLTYVVGGLTVPISAGFMVVELLPTSSMVCLGAGNLVALLLAIVGTIMWGVEAATMHSKLQQAEGLLGAEWLETAVGLSWCNLALFLCASVIKMLAPTLSSCIDSASMHLGRLCPAGCMPACDACCCLDVRTAKVPRDVLRHGRVVVRFLSWNQDLVAAAPTLAAPDEQMGMTRDDYRTTFELQS